MLFASGPSLFDAVAKFQSSTLIEYIDLCFVGSIFSLNLLSLIFVIFKLPKSILFLNIYYIFFLTFILIGFLGNYIDDELTSTYAITSLLIGILLALLIFVINKFKYKEIKYDNIENIGHND